MKVSEEQKQALIKAYNDLMFSMYSTSNTETAEQKANFASHHFEQGIEVALKLIYDKED